MVTSTSIFLHYLSFWQPLSYVIIFIGMMFEGDVILFTVAFLAEQGIFDPLGIFLVAMFGAVAGDLLWYFGGLEFKKIHASVSFIKRWIEKFSGPLDHHLDNRLTHTIFVSKFAYGFNHLALMRAGMKGIKLRKIIKANVLATFVWVVIVGGLGYLSGASFALVKHYLRVAEIGLFISVVVFFLLWHFVVIKQIKKEL